MKKIFFKSLTLLVILNFFSGCYSVFNGGTGGLIVDAESTSSPKRGITNVDIYAYTSEDDRDSDFEDWQENTVFSPSTSYYGHTTTDAEGSFVISNIVWKESSPDFGKDADYTTIYLLYYHENYGLTKDQTVITSDSTSDTVYAELTAIKKTTALNISIYDVATSNLTTNNVLVKVSVPQNTDTIDAPAKVYEQIIAGNGSINISYPRWKNADDKAAGKENTPEVSLTYSQSADTITWKACANADNAAGDYAFLSDGFKITKTIQNTSYNISLYGKATRVAVPAVSGTYNQATGAANDGIIIRMKAKDSTGTYSIDCGETSTFMQINGTSGTQTHGHFNGLGTGFYIDDPSYTGKYKTIEVEFYANGSSSALSGSQKTLRSDIASYNFTL